MHSLLAYAIHVNQLRSDNNNLSNVNGFDLFDIFCDAISSLRRDVLRSDNRLFILSHIEIDQKKRTISGVFESGESGYESKLIDVESRDLKHERTDTEAEVVPLFFHFEIPVNSDTGFAVLQKFSTNSMKTVIFNLLKHVMNQSLPEHRLHMNPQLDKNGFKRIMNDGRPTQIKFVKYEMPDDAADAVQNFGKDDELGYFEVSVHARRNRTLSRLKDLVSQSIDRQFENVKAFEIMNEQYDQIKVQVELEGRKRWVNVTNPKNIRTEFPLEETEITFTRGHPDYVGVKEYAEQIVSSLS